VQFLIIIKKFQGYFLSLFGHQIPGSETGSGSKKAGSVSALTPMRIRNTLIIISHNLKLAGGTYQYVDITFSPSHSLVTHSLVGPLNLCLSCSARKLVLVPVPPPAHSTRNPSLKLCSPCSKEELGDQCNAMLLYE
jgi:hypothetical protein